MSDPKRISVTVWTNTLRGVYEWAPSPTTARFALESILRMTDSSRVLAQNLADVVSQRPNLERWRTDAGRLYDRMRIYFENLYIPERMMAWAVEPALYGRWPADFPRHLLGNVTQTDTGFSGLPDASAAAILYNESVEIAREHEAAKSWWMTNTDRDVAEWLLDAKHAALEHAAPGETPTVLDEATQAIDQGLESSGKIFKKAAGGVAIAVGVAALVFLALGGRR